MKYLSIIFLFLASCASYHSALSPYTQDNYDEITAHCEYWEKTEESQNNCFFSIYIWEHEKQHFKKEYL